MTVPSFPLAADPIRFWARIAPERTAIVDRARGRRVSYAALDAEVGRWTRVLRGAGVAPGARVGILAWNRIEHVALLYACVRAGVALVPFNWRLAVAELSRVVRHADVALLLGEARLDPLLEGAAALPPRLDLDRDTRELARLAAMGHPAPDAPADPEAPTLILYTSGSTGEPKGAILPLRQLVWNAVATVQGWELSSADVAPVSTPFFHTGGWHVFATPLLHAGGTVVLLERFDAAELLTVLDEERCTLAFGVPTQFQALVELPAWGRPLPALRHLLSGGAPCPQPLMDRVRAGGVRMREGFGLTECGPNCFTIPDTEALARPGSVGWPLPYLELRLVDEAGRDVPAGEPGELLLRGPQLFAGYLHAPELTAAALAPGGWFRTGDLLRRDADGAYAVCGRRKEMYISGGENVFPGEVEGALLAHPALAEAIVVGVPDARWGEVGCAWLVPRPGATVEPAAILAHARERLAGYKVPKHVRVVDALPRLGSGKVDRRALGEGGAGWGTAGLVESR